MVNWFVLFVRTGSEERVVRLLNERLDSNVYIAFAATKAYPIIKKGRTGKELKLCFPGYVFLSSNEGLEAFYRDIAPLLSGIKEAYYLLNYGGDKRDIIMREYERIVIERLMNAKFHIDGSLGFMEGDQIQITEGPLVGMESKIKKINRRKHTAVVDISTMGDVREVTLMLEIIRKTC